MPTGISTFGQTISRRGKHFTACLERRAINLYTMPLDELATDQSAKQITSTPGFKSDAQFSSDSKEVFYLENGRVNIVNLERGNVRPLSMNLDMNVNFANEKMEIFGQAWRYLRDNFYDDKYHGVDWNGFARLTAADAERERIAKRALDGDDVGEANALI